MSTTTKETKPSQTKRTSGAQLHIGLKPEGTDSPRPMCLSQALPRTAFGLIHSASVHTDLETANLGDGN